MINNVQPYIIMLVPELIIACGALFLLLYGSFRRSDNIYLLQVPAVVIVLSALLSVAVRPWYIDQLGTSMLIIDGWAQFTEALVLIAAAATILTDDDECFSRGRREYAPLILLATLGMMVMVTARDMLPLYLGLELQGLALYILVGLCRDQVKGAEAAAKFFALGALSSAIFLYGISFLYGTVGSLSFDKMALVLADDNAYHGFVIIGIVLVIVGLAFKLALAPFHAWVADVYQGGPTAVIAFLASASKITAVAVLVRLVNDPFVGIIDQIRPMLALLAVLSIVVGSLAALAQTNIKRLMAYGSVAHAGFMVLGLLAGDYQGIAGVFIYMTVYMLATLTTFIVIHGLRRRLIPAQDIHDLAGFSTTHPFMAAGLAVLMLTMAGVPPLAGFFAKFSVLIAAASYQMWIVVVAVLMTVIGAYYYLRIIKLMYFDRPHAPLDRLFPASTSVLLACVGVILVAFALLAGPLSAVAVAVAQSLVG